MSIFYRYYYVFDFVFTHNIGSEILGKEYCSLVVKQLPNVG